MASLAVLPANVLLGIDWTNPLTNGLVACWAPGVSGRDLTGGVAGFGPLDLTYNTQSVLALTAEGMANSSNSGQTSTGAYTGSIPTGHPLRYTTALTNYWRGVSQVSSFPSIPFGAVIYSVTTGGGVLVAGFDDGSGTTSWSAGWNNGGAYTNTSTVSGAQGTIPAVGQVFSACATYTVGGSVLIYQNGVAQGTAASWGGGGAPTAASDAYVEIGAYHGSATQTSCNLWFIWNRALSAAEIGALDDDPYQFIKILSVEPAAYLAGASTVAFLAYSFAQGDGSAAGNFNAPLSGRSEGAALAAPSLNAKLLLTVAARALGRGIAAQAYKLSLGVGSRANAQGRNALAGKTGLAAAGATVAKATARVVSAILFSVASSARARGFGAQAYALALSARSSAEARGRPSFGLLALAIKAAASAVANGRALIGSASQIALYAATAAMGKGALAGKYALAMAAKAFAEANGAPGLTGKTTLSASGGVRSPGRAGIFTGILLYAASRVAGAGRAAASGVTRVAAASLGESRATASGNFVASLRAMAAGRPSGRAAIFTGILLYASSRVAGAGRSAIAGKLGLAARAKAAGASSTPLNAHAPFTTISAIGGAIARGLAALGLITPRTYFPVAVTSANVTMNVAGATFPVEVA